jgi:hypothetical protein
MIDSAGRCTICQQQVPVGTMHTCSGVPYAAGTGTWPSPLRNLEASATTDDIMAEVRALRTALDDTLRNLEVRLRFLELRVIGDPADE